MLIDLLAVPIGPHRPPIDSSQPRAEAFVGFRPTGSSLEVDLTAGE